MLILEDDATPVLNMNDLYNEMREELKQLDDQWDLLYVSIILIVLV